MFKVLIVDDKPENLYLLRTLLEGYNCTVTEARHGAEALIMARKNLPELIISDLLMPVMDGYTLLRNWKADDQFKNIPFIVYTATYTDPKDEKLALDMGADAFILKPEDPEVFMVRIKDIMNAEIEAEFISSKIPEGGEEVLLKEYNSILIRKLEKKTIQLEQSNIALLEDINKRKQIEDEYKKLLIENEKARIALLSISEDQQETERELRESETRHRLLFEHMLEAMAYHKVFFENGRAVDYIYLQVNEAFTAHTGLKDVVGKKISEIIPSIKVSNPELIEQFGRVALTGKTEQYETYVSSSNQWFFTSLYSLGENIVVSVFSNITERKLAEQNIKQSEERLRLSTELGGVAVWEYDFITNTMSRSKNHDQLYGLEWQKKWEMDTFLNATHPKDRDYSNEIIRKSAAPGGPDQYKFDFRVIHPDKSIHWLMVIGQVTERNSNGEGIQVRGCLIDITERKLNEEEIRRYENIVSASSDLMAFLDTDFRYLAANKAYLNAFNLTQDQIRNLTVADIFGKEFFEQVVKPNVDLCLAGENINYQEWFKLSNDSKRYLDVNYFPFSDNEKNVTGFVVNARDITERNLSEEKLRRSEESFSKIFHASPFPINLFRLSDGRSVDVNNAFLELTGYSKEEFINNSASDLNLFVDTKARNTWINEILKFGKAVSLETKIRNKSGEIIDVLGKIEIIEISQEKLGLSMAIDITENKIAQIELEKSRKQFKSIADNLPGVVTQYKVNPDGTDEHLYVGEGTEKIWGLSREEVLKDTKLIWDLVYEPDKEGLKKSVEISFNNLTPWSLEWRIKQPDNSMKWLHGMGVPHKQPDGSVVWDTIILDISKRKKAENELEEAHIELRKLFANLDKMVEEERKSIARELHDELGQVLTFIKMNLSLLQNTIKKDDFKKEHLIKEFIEMQSVVDDSKDNLRNLIHTLRPEYLDHLGLISALEHLVKEMMDDTGILIRFEYDSEKIKLDSKVENIIFRVIQEAFTNIAKHSKAKNVEIKMRLTDKNLIVTINDDGIGIKPSELKKSGSFGIVGMRERLAIINSELLLSSQKGIGTTIKFTIEL